MENVENIEMVGFASLLIIFMLPLRALSADTDSVPVQEAINQLSGSVSETQFFCGDCKSSPPELWFGPSPVRWSAKEGCSSFSVSNLCDQVLPGCIDQFGYTGCWAGFAPKLSATRVASATLKKYIFEKTHETFQRMVRDPGMQETCCGRSAACKARFAQTRLMVLKGLPSDDSTAQYDPNTHSVEASEGKLINHFTEEGIERVLLHELGHSCQFSRHHRDRSSVDLTLSCNEKPHVSLADLTGLLPQTVLNCLVDTLESEIRERKSNGAAWCRPNYYMEAFADMVFVGRKKKLTHWQWDCFSSGDGEHPTADRMMKCAFLRADVKKNFCP